MVTITITNTWTRTTQQHCTIIISLITTANIRITELEAVPLRVDVVEAVDSSCNRTTITRRTTPMDLE